MIFKASDLFRPQDPPESVPPPPLEENKVIGHAAPTVFSSSGALPPGVEELLREIPEGISTKELLAEISRVDPYIWLITNCRIRKQKTVFNMMATINEWIMDGMKPPHQVLLRHRPFLIEPLRDDHPYKTYLKPRQVGMSEIVLREELWFLAMHPDTKWIHTFPREKQLEDFSTTRVAPALEETPAMRALLGKPNTAHTRRIGDSYLLMRSAWSDALGEGVDADGVTFDEKDRMKDNIEEAFKESLSSSAYGHIRDVSTPTVPNKGVHKSYVRSDQKEWFVQCKKCGLKQNLDHEHNLLQVMDVPEDEAEDIPEGSYRYCCRKESCRGELDRYHGEWVPQKPDKKEVSGYRMTQMMCVWHSATDIMRKKRGKPISMWMNYVLGLPSMGDTILLNDDDFEAASSNYKFPLGRRTRDFDRITVGIDWGKKNWVTVKGRNVHNGMTYYLDVFSVIDTNTKLESTREIAHRIAPYRPDMIVADDGYGKERNELLLEIYPEILWMCRYNPSSQKKARSLEPQWHENSRVVLVDRTLVLKGTCRRFRRKRMGMPSREIKEIKELEQHFKNLAPSIKEEEGVVFEVIENSGPDHYAHASAYADLAMARVTGQDDFSWAFFDAEGGQLQFPGVY